MIDDGCLRLYFRLPRQQIAYVRYIVESYEGLAQVSSPAGRGEMEWVVPRCLATQAEALAQALAQEVGLQRISRPADWSLD